MPHEVASATGCSLEYATGVLFILLAENVAVAKLLVYHVGDPIDPPAPILSRDLADGLPGTPFVCNLCGDEVESSDELLYDLIFELTRQVRFAR